MDPLVGVPDDFFLSSASLTTLAYHGGHVYRQTKRGAPMAQGAASNDKRREYREECPDLGQTYMPEGGVAGRAEQVATLSRLVHEMLVSRETAELIAALEEPESCSGDFALVRLARREYERAAKLPNRLV